MSSTTVPADSWRVLLTGAANRQRWFVAGLAVPPTNTEARPLFGIAAVNGCFGSNPTWLPIDCVWE